MAGNISKERMHAINEATADIIEQKAKEILKTKVDTETFVGETAKMKETDVELQAEIDNKADKQTVNGGFAAGDTGSSALAGGAIGDAARTNNGASVGMRTNSQNGAAAGSNAYAQNGGAVGFEAIASNGFAGGKEAKTILPVDEDYIPIDAIQLGTGINSTPKTLQVYDYQLMDAEGNIPIERMAKEVEAREAKDAELQAAIDAETQARIDEDASLHGSIAATNINMEMGDRELQAAIDAEVQARETEDYSLLCKIDEKQDKTYVDDYTNNPSAITYNLNSNHNYDRRFIVPITSFSFNIPDAVYQTDYITSLSFGTGDTAPQVSYSATGILNWVGTDCSVSEGKSIFAPKANTRYDIVIYFNGMQFVGLVNGFIPATINNSGQTEETTS